jgi:chromate reductase
MTQIAVFVGSLRADSLNKKLAKNLENLAPEGTVFKYVDIASLPLFNQELEADYPSGAQAVKDMVESSDGVLIVTPEYNRGIPGVLKNAIDWASRPHGANSFDGKPTGIVGASGGLLGTGPAQAQLRNVMLYLNTKLLGQPEVYFVHAKDLFDGDGKVVETSREYLKNYIDTLVEHIERMK